MACRTEFLRVMAERRDYERGSPDHEYRSRAARKLVWIMRGIPAARWTE